MEDKVNVFKIIVNATHELTDVVKEIHSSKAERIVLTFTDQTDLLISPINLKVLQEVAQKEDKVLIAQIIQNPTGVRNSRLAGIKVIETPSAPTQQDWEDAVEEIESKAREKISKKKIEELAKEEEALSKTSSFEDRVNSVISKSKDEKYIDRRGEKNKDEFISIDQDLPSQKKDSLAGRDFATMPEENVPPVIKPKGDSISKKFTSGLKSFDFKNKKFLRIVVIALIALLVIPGVTFAIYNQMVPIVKVKIFVEAKPVEIEKTFVGDPNIKEIDFDNLKIPIKTGEETQSLSDTITPTGQAFKGEKAKGAVTITYFPGGAECADSDPTVNLAVGHVIVMQKYSYKLSEAAQISCNGMKTVNVIAADIGEEYNIPSGKSFSVQGYGSEVYGLNAAAFTGGTKEEYTVLSQQDLDSAVERLSETAIEEVKSDLREKETKWNIIENSIKSEVDKESIKTDKKVGEEASVVNVDITIKGTATYYYTKNLNEGLTTLLREEAIEQNLFETEDDLELVLGDEIDTELTVDDTVKDSVQIKLNAKSSVKPKIDKTMIENTLKGMSFADGLKYIQTLDYSDQKTIVQFIPNNYPEFLKKFPNRRGGVLIEIAEIRAEE
ncbi:MAG: baseplate J/gp47 family protein [Candidatus Dojkabacteria bacterium]|jgi:hypothetical protein|nr:baseplate J/gp47 family protein [Candidatus Dojkabacteria bacterium]